VPLLHLQSTYDPAIWIWGRGRPGFIFLFLHVVQAPSIPTIGISQRVNFLRQSQGSRRPTLQYCTSPTASTSARAAGCGSSGARPRRESSSGPHSRGEDRAAGGGGAASGPLFRRSDHAGRCDGRSAQRTLRCG